MLSAAQIGGFIAAVLIYLKETSDDKKDSD